MLGRHDCASSGPIVRLEEGVEKPFGRALSRHGMKKKFTQKIKAKKKIKKIFCFFFFCSMKLQNEATELPGVVLVSLAPSARGVATTGDTPAREKKTDKPNAHSRHLIQDLWGNPQKSRKHSTLFVITFFFGFVPQDASTPLPGPPGLTFGARTCEVTR